MYDRYSDDFCSGKVAPDFCSYIKYSLPPCASDSHTYSETELVFLGFIYFTGLLSVMYSTSSDFRHSSKAQDETHLHS